MSIYRNEWNCLQELMDEILELAIKLFKVTIDFNLVQYFTANIFSIKEHKRYNGKYTHYIEIFPLETQTGKTNIFYIHS
jgi:hypothetical protein